MLYDHVIACPVSGLEAYSIVLRIDIAVTYGHMGTSIDVQSIVGYRSDRLDLYPFDIDVIAIPIQFCPTAALPEEDVGDIYLATPGKA